MTQIPTRDHFVEAYSGEAPWDIGRPQPPFLAVADRVQSPVLDSGCGTGDTALHFAAFGHQVTGYDYLEEPIRRARAKAAERNLTVDFRVADALKLTEWTERFNTVFDSGVFHVFTDDDRRRYVAGLTHVMNPGGNLFLLCFSENEPGTQGPRRVTRDELATAFADGWQIESVQPVQFELNPKFTGATFSEGGPMAWFATIRRQGSMV